MLGVLPFYVFSSCQNVNFNEKFLQTGLLLTGMGLQTQPGLGESEMLVDVCFLMLTGVQAT